MRAGIEITITDEDRRLEVITRNRTNTVQSTHPGPSRSLSGRSAVRAHCKDSSDSICPTPYYTASGTRYSIFRSSCIVSCSSEVVGAFGGREDFDEAPDGVPKALNRAL